MRKLELKLDELEVESFPVSEENAGRGTVQGNQHYSYWDPYSCDADTCSGGRLCQCATREHSYCMECFTNEVSYCVMCP